MSSCDLSHAHLFPIGFKSGIQRPLCIGEVFNLEDCCDPEELPVIEKFLFLAANIRERLEAIENQDCDCVCSGTGKFAPAN